MLIQVYDCPNQEPLKFWDEAELSGQADGPFICGICLTLSRRTKATDNPFYKNIGYRNNLDKFLSFDVI